MKNVHAFYIPALLVLTAIIVILIMRDDSSVPGNRSGSPEQGVLTLRIDGRGDFTDAPTIKDACTEKMTRYLRKAMDLSREIENGQSITGCALIESRIGNSEAECGSPVALGGCSICKIRCQ